MVAAGVLRQIGQIWHRLVLHYSHWPWRLAALSDSRVDMAQKMAVAEECVSATPCCMGVALLPLQQRLQSGSDLLSAGNHKLLSCMFHATRTQTISVETRLSRSRAHSASAAGNPPTLATICSNHLISEAGSMHHQLQEICGASARGHNQRQVKTKRAPQRQLSGWNVFIAERMNNEPGTSSGVVAANHCAKAAWAELDVAQKARYNLKARLSSIQKSATAAQAAVSDQRSQDQLSFNIVTRSVWGLGDKDYPYAVATLQDEMSRAQASADNLVHNMSAVWRQEFEDPIVGNVLEPFPSHVDPPQALCSEVYGCRCKLSLRDDEVQTIDQHNGILDSIVNNMPRKCIERAPLLWFEAFGDGDMVAQKLVLWIANCGNPSFQIYAVCTLLTAKGEVATDTYSGQLVGSAAMVKVNIEQAHGWKIPGLMTSSHLGCQMVAAASSQASW